MRGFVVGTLAATLALAVVGLWALRTEPVGPLLALPTPDRPVESQPNDEPEFASESLFLPLDMETSDQNPPHTAISVVSEDRRQHVRKLLQKLRPQHDPDAIDVWVEQFANMADEEITFLMTQSESMTGVPGITPLSSGLQSDLFEPATSSEHSLSPEDSDARRWPESGADTARQNLRNSMTVGYRDQLAINIVSAGLPTTTEQLTLPRLTCGPLLNTGDPLHLALETPGLVFFLLEDGRLTRNGSFCRMEDGRLGLKASPGYVALHESPILSEDTVYSISSNGQVVARGADQPVGTIHVVTVAAGKLTSDDGVYFRTTGDVSPATEFQLKSTALELSNVDVEHNNRLLDAIATRN